MKIQSIKFGNAIKAGTVETNFLTDKEYEISIDELIVTVVQRSSKQSVCTSLMNVVWWIPQPVFEIQPDPKGKSVNLVSKKPVKGNAAA